MTRGHAENQDPRNVRETFDRFWKEAGALPEADDVGADITGIIRSLVPAMEGASFIEVGSGSGRMSLALAKQGARVFLLDTSETAMELGRDFFAAAGLEGEFILGSGFSLPCRNGAFDITWNTGLIEHFLFDDQVRLLSEMLRVTRPGGLVMTFNPSAQGWLYRLGKYLMERRGTWVFGREIPIGTLRPHCRVLGAAMAAEWNAGFDLQLVFLGRYFGPVKRFIRRRPALNRLLARIFGGYLKISIIQKAS